MPCYQIRTVSIEFHVGNVDLLKKALEAAGWNISNITTGAIYAKNNNLRKSIRIGLDSTSTTKITSQEFSQTELNNLNNSIKRAYSEQVIDELAKKQRWIKRNMGQGNFQLQRF
jgi:hypothetical protein